MHFKEISLASKYEDFEGLRPREIVEGGRHKEEEEQESKASYDPDDPCEMIIGDLRRYHADHPNPAAEREWRRYEHLVSYIVPHAIKRLDPCYREKPLNRSDVRKIVGEYVFSAEELELITGSVCNELRDRGYKIIVN